MRRVMHVEGLKQGPHCLGTITSEASGFPAEKSYSAS